jgi:Zn-dependent protease
LNEHRCFGAAYTKGSLLFYFCGVVYSKVMMNNATFLIFQFVVLVFSVIIHEISHGLVAEHLGDPTARQAGRITLNPLKHIDLFGSILLPLLLVVTHSPVLLGWAKPVPYNPNLLPNPKSASGKISVAGPLSNFILAAIFGILVRVAIIANASSNMVVLFAIIVIVNLALGVFNLVPIPPLDGSKVLFSILPATEGGYRLMAFLERYGLILIFAFLFFGGSFLAPVITRLFSLLTGQSLF